MHIDDECDGSGTMIYLCETTTVHVHCECGPPVDPVTGICEYCDKERKQVSLHARVPVKETHGDLSEALNYETKEKKEDWFAGIERLFPFTD